MPELSTVTVTFSNKTISGAANTVTNIAQSSVTNLVSDLAAKALDSAVVHNTGNEAVAGIKTFSSSPIVPAPTTDFQASTKKYVDDAAAAAAVDFTKVLTAGGEVMVGADGNIVWVL